MKKKFFIKTYGCQMSGYDSARMADVLESIDYSVTKKIEEADLVILNTCHIREHAEDKIFSELGRLRLLKQKRTDRIIIAVSGCVAQVKGKEILSKAPFVDIVLGPRTYHRLPEMITKVNCTGNRVVATDFNNESKFDYLPTPSVNGSSAFLSVQEGCENFCSFCVVPYTRGAEYSRPASAVLIEAKELVDRGVHEITLLGQNVNGYHGMGINGVEWGLGSLIRAISYIPKLERIRYITSHPKDMSDELIMAHRDIPQLMPFLHLPVQSGSNQILAKMNRRYTADDYRRLIERLRYVQPNIALSSDFIVGFPGESDLDFIATLDLIEDIGFAKAYSFKYSPRYGTKAAGFKEQIEESCKDERLI
ncbi:MAG: tRNA (N6-isopentenyl adenosine(37)-C2)-methylthiotransferase MiaB, partial [Rhodospirillaceae bacterium]|nr:tRNA (N6-isopentenyl adenosine(37)-C2)-methylthiotransferase MiaB [Rhodospirillaceae bacterium]